MVNFLISCTVSIISESIMSINSYNGIRKVECDIRNVNFLFPIFIGNVNLVGNSAVGESICDFDLEGFSKYFFLIPKKYLEKCSRTQPKKSTSRNSLR